MPASPEIREAIRQGSWIRKMFEDGAVLKAERGEENVFDFTLGNPYGDPPAALSAELARLCADPPPGLHRYMPNAGAPEARRAAARSLSPFHRACAVHGGPAGDDRGRRGRAERRAARHPLAGGRGGDPRPLLRGVPLLHPQRRRGTPVVAETDARFQLDLAAVEAALTPKTRAILINTPNNPTGAVYPEADLAALERVLSAAERRFGNPIYVISDEPYRKIVFRGVPSTPAAAKIRNTLVAYSHSKDLNLPGERIGYLAVSPRAADAAEVAGACVFCNRVLGFVNAPALFQLAASKFEDEPADVSVYQENRDVLLDALGRSGIDVVPPGGAFYLFPKSPVPDEMAFLAAARDEGILVVPGSGFGRSGHVRVAYCLSPGNGGGARSPASSGSGAATPARGPRR